MAFANSTSVRSTASITVALLFGIVSLAARAAAPGSAEDSNVCTVTLRPITGIDSNASGSATLRIAPDEKSAVLALQYANLSSATTTIHVDSIGSTSETAKGRTILFDLAGAKPDSDGKYVWSFSPSETTTVEQIVAAIKSGRTALSIETETHPAGEIGGIFRLSRSSQAAVTP